MERDSIAPNENITHAAKDQFDLPLMKYRLWPLLTRLHFILTFGLFQFNESKTPNWFCSRLPIWAATRASSFLFMEIDLYAIVGENKHYALPYRVI